MKRKSLLSMVLALSVAVVSCGDSVPDSAADLCSSLEDLHTTLNQIAGGDSDPNSTVVENIRSAVQDVEGAISDIQGAETDLSDALKSQLQDDLDQLKSSLEGIADDSTLAEAGSDLTSALSTFKQSWDQTMSELNCSTDT